MKITKYPQACFLINYQGINILIDPGVYVFKQMDIKPEDFTKIDLILLTHGDPDHTDPDSLKIIQQHNKCPIWCNKEVKEKLAQNSISVETIEYDEAKEISNIKIKAIKSVHGRIPNKDFLPQVTGFLIDDKIYHPGDTVYLDDKPYADVVLVPICGTVVMDIEEAKRFACDIKPKLLIPMHYDSPNYPGDPEEFIKAMSDCDLRIKVLDFGESIEIE